MTSNQLRSRFLEYFQAKDHRVISSSSLVPDDPTLLLTIAGMVQFKPIFLGQVEPAVRRACTSQKCLRVNDIEHVGYTARHHTFFEMLGNFSFGDYFKLEACRWAWDFLTTVTGLDPDLMWTSVHHQDREAYDIWKDTIGVPAERIVFLGDDDNFWASGPVGPCGYCSEIYYDTGPDRGCGGDGCQPGCDCDRYLEIWNLVFMQFDRKGDGSLDELPSKNIDTGMGLERIASVVQGVTSNFETDLFLPIIREIEQISGMPYRDDALRPHFRVIADHVRSIAFLIGDGIYPSNEGRGYILRRLIRRAYRSGRCLSIEQPFLHTLACSVAQTMGESYPELITQTDLITRLTLQEEKRFEETMRSGLAFLDQVILEARQKDQTAVSGEEVFRLYDTYGFPHELAREVLQEAGMTFSEDDFRREMEQQKTKSRQAQEGKTRDLKDQKSLEQLFEGLKSEFTGYHCATRRTRCLALTREGVRQQRAEPGDRIICVLEHTPFYPERGGQESDRGVVTWPSGGQVRIDQVLPGPQGLILHHGQVEKGPVLVEEEVEARIDDRRRRLLEIHHTATHLLHQALRKTLGETVRQAGSWVGETGLRFDFTHFSPVREEELAQIEDLVNETIFLDMPVRVSYSTLEAAEDRDIIALFDEKYEKTVRIVRVAGYSAELCGGTHLSRTSQAELFTIVSESSIGSGLRRIEAIAGPVALDRLRRGYRINQALKKLAQVEFEALPSVFSALQEENRRLQKELSERTVDTAIRDVLSRVPDQTSGQPVLIAHLFSDGIEAEALKLVLDALRKKVSQALVVLGQAKEGRISGLVAGIGLSPDRNVSALLREALKKTGGRGGGKPQLAQYGGVPLPQWDALVEAMEEAAS